jgi:exosortase A
MIVDGTASDATAPRAGASESRGGAVESRVRAAPEATTTGRLRLDAPAAIVLLLAAVLALYWRTTLSMAAIWQRSETFAHGYVVIPIFLYLVWRQRESLRAIDLAPCYPALLGVAASGAIWLCGELVNTASVAQFAVIAMFQFSVWATLGTRVVKAIGIPLAFLFFAVPFGEFLIPQLMDWTADFTAAAIRASGIPIYREGNFFTIPSGRWSVVEACSGIRYLIASFMVGTLFAYLSYRSTGRRAAFIAASLVVPIVANWFRAYMIVMLGHLTNNRLAVGADHLIYGWIFFGIVMALLFWIGSRWRQDDEPSIEPIGMTAPGAAQRPVHLWAVGVASVLIIAVWQPLEAWIGSAGAGGAANLQEPVAPSGWIATPVDAAAFRPDVSGARAGLRQAYAKNGAKVGLDVSFFKNQSHDAKAITSTNQLVTTTNPRWLRVGDSTAAIDIDGKAFRPRATILMGERDRLLVWHWFWVDGQVTSSEIVAKLYQLLAIARGHGDPAAWVVAYTSLGRGEAQATATLQAFVADMGGPIDVVLQKAAAE